MNIRIKSATGLQVLGKIIHLGSFHSQLRKGGRQVSRALDGHLRHHPSNIFAKIPNRNLTKTLEYRLIGHNGMGTILNGTMGMKSEKSKTIICSSTKKFSGKKKGGGKGTYRYRLRDKKCNDQMERISIQMCVCAFLIMRQLGET